jgi:hypothetical protein
VAENGNLAKLITDVKESLERELHSIDQKLNQKLTEGFSQINTRFDTQAARLERHAGLWQTGTRWSARMDD